MTIESVAGSPPATREEIEELRARYRAIRARTEELCRPLEIEDYVVQTMPDVSPTKWHLAHTSWFFETFLLSPFLDGYRPSQPIFEALFNSYYNTVGKQVPREERGFMSRPTVAEVFSYRAHVDEGMDTLFASPSFGSVEIGLLETGLQHEQQHQELIVTDLKHVLVRSPLEPTYLTRSAEPCPPAPPVRWIRFSEAIRELGHDGKGFSFDNEGPRHRVLVGEFELASRPVTAGEYTEFIEAGGYRTHSLWLSEGWARVRDESWDSPLYWRRDDDGGYRHFTLAGRRRVDPSEPVTHLSYYEADAFARWAGARLPTEAEWETAASGLPVEGLFADSGRFHPAPAPAEQEGLLQMYGDVWEWTQSAYGPYPGYAPAEGALGEYNGKFMSGQMVLRGGSVASPEGHLRPTYRNFWHPWTRWQYSGLRLARLP